MKYTIGIDISTTATKSLLMDEYGSVVDVAAFEYPYETSHPLWSEQDPKIWWKATCFTLNTLINKNSILPKDILSIGLTGQMHGLVLINKYGDVIRPCIIWNDQRTSSECDDLRIIIGKENLIRITGNDALSGFTLPKILWVKKNEPAFFEKVAHVLLPKDYVRFCLTGEYATDVADASGTLLLDLKSRSWSTEIIKATGINPDWLPGLFEGSQITGRISKQGALATGLLEGTPVVAGGGDQEAQAIGVGVVKEGVIALTLGTSGVVFASTKEPIFDPKGKLHSFCHSVPGLWHVMGVMLSAAGSLRWYRDTLAQNIPYDILLQPAESIPPGAEDLYFLPYLSGERTPHPDPYAKGVFLGLTHRHTQAHLTRSVLEGVAFGLKDCYDLMRSIGLPNVNEIRVSGGGARSALWRQILSDVFATDLYTVNTIEGAAFGAAILAAVGSGIWASVDVACNQVIKTSSVTKVNDTNALIYKRVHQNYDNLYPVLRNTFQTLYKK